MPLIQRSHGLTAPNKPKSRQVSRPTKGCCKGKNIPKIKKIESGWMGPGPVWIENWKKKQKIKIFDDYLFRLI